MTAALPLPIRLFVRVGLLILLGMFVVWLMKVLFVLAFFGLVGYAALCVVLLMAGARPPSLSACTGWLRGTLEYVANLVKESVARIEEDVKGLFACFSTARAVEEKRAEPEVVAALQPAGISRTRLIWWTCVESACGGLVGLLAVGLACMGKAMDARVGLSLGGAALLGTMLGALVSLTRPRTRADERGE